MKGREPLIDDMIYLQVPQPLYHVDAQLNLMAMLEFVVSHTQEEVTDEERRLVADWFAGRYGGGDAT